MADAILWHEWLMAISGILLGFAMAVIYWYGMVRNDVHMALLGTWLGVVTTILILLLGGAL